MCKFFYNVNHLNICSQFDYFCTAASAKIKKHATFKNISNMYIVVIYYIVHSEKRKVSINHIFQKNML
ncbi:hypothetical protein C923_01638 [Plasmodium falciparum UGT5.1]|uniref:Uncharacterized protein n=2 Tax=Plasmodium falciparum TaxID=5833 RepID=W7JFC8_PLAFA|nr:hypothetical protein PFBG_01552 [Plasmodium falciparum 7G8]EWC77695.1 hypothetical protein C923_01638 [Plasmodium falciparum UGT5.1]